MIADCHKKLVARILLLMVMAGLSATHAEEPAQLASLIKSIGPCKHLSVERIVGVWVGDKFGHGFKYETSDPKTIARILALFQNMPARDTWERFNGTHGTPDAPCVVTMDFTKTDGQMMDLFIIEPHELLFNSDQMFEFQPNEMAEFYRLIGKQDAVSESALAIWTAPRAATYYIYDGDTDYHTRQRKVRDVQPVNRDPLFDNAPYYRLREGDRLVKAREVVDIGPGKAKPEKEPADLQYYLESRGIYFQLRAEEKDGKLLLAETPDSASACMLFDWEMSVANVKAIRAMLPKEWSESLSLKEYAEIVRATRSKFPGLITKVTTLEPRLEGDRILMSYVPGLDPSAESDGLIFDRRQNEIRYYQVRIAPWGFSVEATTLLQGPRPLKRSEAEAAAKSAMAGKSRKHSDPAAAQQMKAENEQAIEFQNMVEGIIQQGGNTGGGEPAKC